MREPVHPQADATEWFWVELGLQVDRWRPGDHPLVAALGAERVGQHALAQLTREHDHVLCAAARRARWAAGRDEGLRADALATDAARRRRRVLAWRAFAQRVDSGGSAASLIQHGSSPGTLEAVGCLEAADTVAAQVALLVAWDRLDGMLGVQLAHALTGSRHRLGAAGVAACAEPAGGGTPRLSAALEGLLSDADVFALLRGAGRLARGYWHLLDEIHAHHHLDREGRFP